jgi:hypothetical protein
MEMGYGGSYMGNMSYGPMMESGCSSCSGNAGIPTPAAASPPADAPVPRPNPN